MMHSGSAGLTVGQGFAQCAFPSERVVYGIIAGCGTHPGTSLLNLPTSEQHHWIASLRDPSASVHLAPRYAENVLQ
jgi:hypothetical protein